MCMEIYVTQAYCTPVWYRWHVKEGAHFEMKHMGNYKIIYSKKCMDKIGILLSKPPVKMQ